jgi:ferric-dicitrate binding protein FerR (iron transport regulator)
MKDQQVERASRIASLIVKRMQDSLSQKEQAELDAWLHEDSENFLLYEELMDENRLTGDLAQLQSIDHESAYQRLAGRLFHTIPVVKTNTRRIWYFAAAAILVLGVSAWILYSQWNQKPDAANIATTTQQEWDNIKPGSKKAILTLADGRQIDLDNNKQGIIAKEGNNTIQQSHAGKLYYSENSHSFSSGNTAPKNTLYVPRSGEYNVTLNDGTIVWLNALSTLRFPVQFGLAERRVSLEGEAYFQVAKDAARPFIVEVDSVEVRALGTEFNITAYPEDKKMEAALVHGLISISKNSAQHLLKPGSVAEIPDTGDIEIKKADIEEVTGWKNGVFVFHNTSLSDIMNQFARWYDIDVEYPDGVPTINFTGALKRVDGIYRVINLLELTGEVRFTVHGRKILVYPTH